ncbi:ATP-dependent protease, partial [Vibrio sp. 10N.222.49.C9]
DKKTQANFEKTIDTLEISLRHIIRDLTEWEEQYSDKIQKLNSDVTLDVIGHFVKELKIKYKKHPEVKQHLAELQADIVENVDIFLEESNEQGEIATASLDKKLPRRYKV